MTTQYTTAQISALATINGVITSYGYKPLPASCITLWGLTGDEDDCDLIQWANDEVSERDSEQNEPHEDTPHLDVSDHNYEMNGWR